MGGCRSNPPFLIKKYIKKANKRGFCCGKKVKIYKYKKTKKEARSNHIPKGNTGNAPGTSESPERRKTKKHIKKKRPGTVNRAPGQARLDPKGATHTTNQGTTSTERRTNREPNTNDCY